MVGTAIEFYDNYCYSIAAASYFGAIFFANVTDPVLAQIMAFTTFAVSLLARPFGSMLFGHFGDKMGRKKTLVIALLTMGIATFLVGCLPVSVDRPFRNRAVRGKRRNRVVVGMIVAFQIDEARRKQQCKDRDRNHDPKEPFLLLCAVFFMRPPE